MLLTVAAVMLAVGFSAFAFRNNATPVRVSDRDTRERIVELEQTIRSLEAMGTRASRKQQWEAARWIAGRFEEAGLATTIEVYDRGGQAWPNVVARIPGARASEDAVIVAAHLDSIAGGSQVAPGADDNGTGVAVAIQVARDLLSARLGRPVVFSVFSNEERGTIGSRSFARSARARRAAIKAVINIDVLGYNRPEWSALLQAVSADGSARYKLRAAWRAVRNAAIGWREAPDSMTVGGRDRNRDLVQHIAGAMSGVRGLSVRPLVDDACG